MKIEDIDVRIPAWNIREYCGYEPQTTFWQDFSIADSFGPAAIRETFDRAFGDWRGNTVYLTELVLVLNHKIWQWYEKSDDLTALYDKLWRVADGWACANLDGEDLEYFYRTTD